MKRSKILSALLAMLLILSSLPAFALNASMETTTWENDIPAASEIDADGINTYGELAYAIANGAENQTITLTGDIDLGGNTLKNADFGKLLNGMVIDGAGFTIKNFVVEATHNFGLFTVATNAHIKIKNLNVGSANAPITGTLNATKVSENAERTSIGILIGNGAAGFSFDIENVHAYTELKASLENTTNLYAGGLIGWVKMTANSSIKDCSVSGLIQNTMAVKTGSTNIITYTGGFIGHVQGAYNLTISNCVNNAEVKGGRHAAGFISTINEATASLEMSNCINNGNITSVLGAGGFIYYNKAKTVIQNCVNVGTVTMDSDGLKQGTMGCGGLVGGQIGGTLTFEKCINAGAVVMKNAEGATASAGGGIIGIVNAGKATVTNSVVVDDVTSTNVPASQAVGYVKNASYLEKVESCIYLGTVTGTDNVTADDVRTEGDAAATDNVIWQATAQNVTALNALVKSWGCGEYFYLDNTGDTVAVKYNQRTPQLVGVQKTAVANGTFDIRFVAVMKEENLNHYQNVGFSVTPVTGTTLGDTQELKSTVVFSNLKAGTKSYTAEELGGEYIIALSITGIPATGTVGVIVSPYATLHGSETALGGTVWTLTYTDGALTGAVVTENI